MSQPPQPPPQQPWGRPVEPGLPVPYAPPPPGYGPAPGYGPPPTDRLIVVAAPTKDLTVAYLLWFFLGGFGIDRFYVGKIVEGAIVLLLTLLGWGTVWVFGLGLVFFLVVAVWWVVNAVRLPGEVSLANARALAAMRGY